nr:very short patch repair endonuclease [Luteimonas sp. MC1572]
MTPEERSERMSRIRSRDTSPELLVRRFLHAAGFRYRLHVRDLPGRPDIVLPKYKAVVLVNGCFWHAHHCQKGRVPGTRSEFWANKFQKNRKRDRANRRLLREAGWSVITLWECSLSKRRVDKELDRLAQKILAAPGK